jgi:hypothetical protein
MKTPRSPRVLDAGFKAVCTRRSKACRETGGSHAKSRPKARAPKGSRSQGLERSRLMALESIAWSARCRAMVQISRSKAKSAFPTHSTWLSIQCTAIIIVALSGERRVGSVSRSIRKKPLPGRPALAWHRSPRTVRNMFSAANPLVLCQGSRQRSVNAASTPA